MTSAAPNRWIRAREAVTKIAPHVGGDAQAKALIAGRFRDDIIQASADYVTEGCDFGPIPQVTPTRVLKAIEAATNARAPEREVEPFSPSYPEVSDSKIGTPYVFWESKRGRRTFLGPAIAQHSFDWEKDLARWQWGAGTFVFSRPALITGKNLPPDVPLSARFPTRIVAYDVEFDRKDIDSIVAAFRTHPANHAPRSGPKRRRVARGYDWTDVHLHLAAFAYVRSLEQEFGMGFGESGFRAELIIWIENYLRNAGVEAGSSQIGAEADRFMEAVAREKNRVR